MAAASQEPVPDFAGRPDRTAEYVRTVLEPHLPPSFFAAEGGASLVQRDQSGDLPDGSLQGARACWFHVVSDIFPGVTPEVWRKQPHGESSAAISLFSSLRDATEESARARAAGDRSRHVSLPLPAPELRASPGGSGALLLARPNVEDHAHVVLAAWARLGAEAPLLRWVVADGEVSEARAILQRASAFERFPAESITLEGGRSTVRLPELLAEADFVFLLLRSAVDSLGPALPLALASGVAAVVLDFAETALLPAGVVEKVLPGPSESEAVAMVVRRYLFGRGAAELRRGLGGRAMSYAREAHSPRVIAAELRSMLR